jgi:hypothetical protein
MRSEQQVTAITARLRHARRLMSSSKQVPVHFHIDGYGRAFVCDLHACDSVPLSLDEATRADRSVS